MLHEVAAGDLEPNHICNPLRKLLGRVVVLTGNVGSIDLSQKRVTISYSTSLICRDLLFDYPCLGIGLGHELRRSSRGGRARVRHKNSRRRVAAK